jgi:hypothetical protein
MFKRHAKVFFIPNSVAEHSTSNLMPHQIENIINLPKAAEHDAVQRERHFARLANGVQGVMEAIERP